MDRALELARQLAEAMAPLNSTERDKVVEIIKERWCLKCGGTGPEWDCWCDYSTPSD